MLLHRSVAALAKAWSFISGDSAGLDNPPFGKGGYGRRVSSQAILVGRLRPQVFAFNSRILNYSSALKTIGTIIGRIPLTETSLIVQWCTATNGILKTVARGARKPKSPFAGKVDLFFKCEIEVHPAKRGDLHTLKDLEIIDTRLGLRKSYRQTLAASYFVKLIDRAAEPATPIPELDDLLNRALNYLNDTDADMKAVLHFEKQLAEILGVINPQSDNATSLLNHFGNLPKQREELVKRLQPTH